ncbi:NAD(P)H-dependent oxidoreductase [Brevibacillus brevis]|uniref:NAD(P)H-dependent oxidoreductase n=1 Tax=Brevibacillus brevis TaxID=1393 RepID=A0ABY9T7V7_BREBE|nr:NAD(P)H-dependent oxidoreductase [Brevibacillus brevis]WNC15979.1 NAD(P)H-dependent oxidoreductase [Brevibacillus brevis]
MKILVLIAHPRFKESKANRALAQELEKYEDIDILDLYEEYPDWQIDVQQEQRRLLAYDRVVFQFPFYWYSCPPLLKLWFDEVLTFGWAFGPGGVHLQGKEFLIATTAGGTVNAYRSGGDNRYTVSELLRPIEQTITKCNGTYLPAYVLYDANRGTDEIFAAEAEKYVDHIRSALPVLAH